MLDADLLEAVLGGPDPGKKGKEIEIKISRWLRKGHDPRFKELGERLEALKVRPEDRCSSTGCTRTGPVRPGVRVYP